ncbi:MAG: hypothetical protein INQ03_01540 [Candidatus Heimdallarchaeota archaeon]|nr:hypothetical protein [Candidatus Heimdallarchaeota archaeon]
MANIGLIVITVAILAFLIGKFKPRSYHKIILLLSPFVGTSVIIIDGYATTNNPNLFSGLLIFLVPFYMFISLFFGLLALIPAYIGTKFGNTTPIYQDGLIQEY